MKRFISGIYFSWLIVIACTAQIIQPPRGNLTQEEYMEVLIDSLAMAEKELDTANTIRFSCTLTTEYQSAKMKDRAAYYLGIAIRYAEAYSNSPSIATVEVGNRAGMLLMSMGANVSVPLLDSSLYWHRRALHGALAINSVTQAGWAYCGLLRTALYHPNEAVRDSIPFYFDKAISINPNDLGLIMESTSRYIQHLVKVRDWETARPLIEAQSNRQHAMNHKDRVMFFRVTHDYLAGINHLDTLRELRTLLMNSYDYVVASSHKQEIYAKDQQYEVSKTKNILEATSIRLKATNQVLIVVIVSLIAFGFLVVYLFFLFRKNKKLSQRNELLLREQNHRVKNNLQMISSLLSLQSQKLLSSDAKDALQESQSRIHSVALLHRMLYEGENVGNIEVTEYIRSLTEEIRYSAGREIQIDLDLPEKMEMKIETVTSLGLIVNELLTNSIKHVVDTIPLCVSLHVSFSNGVLHLIYSDNGPGAAPEVWMSSESFGNQLIRMQSKQLKGEYEVSGTNGFRYELKVSA